MNHSNKLIQYMLLGILLINPIHAMNPSPKEKTIPQPFSGALEDTQNEQDRQAQQRNEQHQQSSSANQSSKATDDDEDNNAPETSKN